MNTTTHLIGGQSEASDAATKNPVWTGPRHARDHEILNRVVFTPDQIARIESERPLDGVSERTLSDYELAAYRMPNGSRFVTLCDGSVRIWELYCAERTGVHYTGT